MMLLVRDGDQKLLGAVHVGSFWRVSPFIKFPRMVNHFDFSLKHAPSGVPLTPTYEIETFEVRRWIYRPEIKRLLIHRLMTRREVQAFEAIQQRPYVLTHCLVAAPHKVDILRECGVFTPIWWMRPVSPDDDVIIKRGVLDKMKKRIADLEADVRHYEVQNLKLSLIAYPPRMGEL